MTALAMILDAAARFADRPAIEEADGRVITCAALIARARGHAATTGAGEVVDVVGERTADFVARCLGAWLAGAAFHPIDPADPRDRHASAAAGSLDHALAYVIATSGSSGAPKLVRIAHRGIPALLRAQVAAFALAPAARALWLHAPWFDASISDWGTALAAGATLVVPSPAALASPVRLRAELVERAITHVDLPPLLLGALDPIPPALRVVVLGGEACPVDRVRALARHVHVVIVYGPTEATVCSSLVVVDPARWDRPMIGAPLPGVRYRVIDGELHIGGDALALGYVDAAETARRFVDVDGDRMYRTGDLVEPHDGGLAFVGRVDRQRKLAGRRVELDEIEAALCRLPGVTAAAVTIRAIVPGGRERLVGFVDGEAGPQLRPALRARVPAWMVPVRIVCGPLPRTATGKLDRAALARVDLATPCATHADRDPLEADLAAAWCGAIGIDAVAPGDRFEDVGGDSLARLVFHTAAAARAIALAADALAGDPTFGELCARVRAGAPPITVGEAEQRGRAAHARVRGVTARAPVDEAEERGRARHGSSVGGRGWSGADASARRRGVPGIANGPVRGVTVGAPARGAVLVTGATGLLGGALVRAWRARDPRPIIALVRGADPARDAALLGVAPCELVRGDVARPYFGLDAATWRRLVDRVSAVIHGAATIALGAGWATHAATNVEGTAEVARFVAAGPAIAWHHISTLSVFASTDRAAGRHDEAALPAADALAYGGYAQTKLAAEAIARAHRDSHTRRGPTTIFRPGLLVSGRPRADQLAMTIRGLARLGAVPAAAAALRFDLSPVDHVADAIAALAARAEQAGLDETHHLASPGGVTCAALIAAIRAAGAPVVELATPAWCARARDGLGDPEIAMTYAAFLRAIGAPAATAGAVDLFLATGADFGVERTRGLLAELGVAPPVLDDALAPLVRAALAEAS